MVARLLPETAHNILLTCILTYFTYLLQRSHLLYKLAYFLGHLVYYITRQQMPWNSLSYTWKMFALKVVFCGEKHFTMFMVVPIARKIIWYFYKYLFNFPWFIYWLMFIPCFYAIYMLFYCFLTQSDCSILIVGLIIWSIRVNILLVFLLILNMAGFEVGVSAGYDDLWSGGIWLWGTVQPVQSMERWTLNGDDDDDDSYNCAHRIQGEVEIFILFWWWFQL